MTNQSIANILFSLAECFWAIELIPQIIKTYKTKCVNDISLPYYVICLSGYVTFLTGAIFIKQWFLIASHIPSFLMLLIMLYLIIKCRGNK